jgi:MraZ protein
MTPVTQNCNKERAGLVLLRKSVAGGRRWTRSGMRESFVRRLSLRTRVNKRGFYKGHALNAIDAKGRVAIPADLRTVIELNTPRGDEPIGKGRNFILSNHERSPCLTGYDEGWSQLLYERINRDEEIERAAGRSFDRDNANRAAFGNALDMPYDNSGRFILPGFLRQKGQLEDLAFFYGTANVFEIWNPRILLSTPELFEGMREACAWAMKERGEA